VVQILLDRAIRLPLDEVVVEAQAGYGATEGPGPEGTRRQLLEFFRGRTQAVLQERGFPLELVEAILSAGSTDIADAARRAAAMAVLRREADFGELCVAFRRVAGIIPSGFDRPVDPGRLVEGAERALYAQAAELKAEVERLVAEQEYLGALRRIAALKPMVDMFFEEVLVIGPDEALTQNRFALLKTVADLFARIADFTKFPG
jgi:glycyl-tRNA synthetase beta chain